MWPWSCVLGSRGTTSESLFSFFFFPPTVQQHAPLCVGKKLGMSCLLRKLASRKKNVTFHTDIVKGCLGEGIWIPGKESSDLGLLCSMPVSWQQELSIFSEKKKKKKIAKMKSPICRLAFRPWFRKVLWEVIMSFGIRRNHAWSTKHSVQVRQYCPWFFFWMLNHLQSPRHGALYGWCTMEKMLSFPTLPELLERQAQSQPHLLVMF